MSKTIDCFLIGFNETDFIKYEQMVRKKGVNSGAYRYLNSSFINYLNRPFNAAQIFNKFSNGKTRCISAQDYFSLTIAYLGSYLTKHGLTFDYANCFQTEKEEIARKLVRENMLTIAVTTTFYESPIEIMEIMEFIKKYNHTAKIIIGGPYIHNQVKLTDPAELNYLFESIGADLYVNSSQGEASLVKIIRALKNNLPLEHINNIYYKTRRGYIPTSILRENNDLSENPVNWSSFADRVGENVAVRTSLSCPFSCTFCSFPGFAGKYKAVGVDFIENELNQIAEIDTVKSVNFIDDTFNIPPKRFKAILRMMIKNKYGFRWHSFFRCQYADREMVALMKESGCQGVFLGLESGNNQILKNMNKHTTVEQYRKGIALLKEYGILIFASFITGFPGETPETVRETIDFIEEGDIEFYRSYIWFCNPLTPIYREKEKFDIKGSQFEWSHAGMDWQTAYDLRDKMYVTIRKSICMPDYNFEFSNIFHLKNRGLSMEHIKAFLKSFHDGIKEKIREPSRKEASPGVIKRLKQSAAGEDIESKVASRINENDSRQFAVDF